MVKRFCVGPAAWLAVAMTAGALPGCGPGAPRRMEPVVPELKLEAVRFRVYRGERLAAQGWAERVRYRRDTGDLVGDDVVAVFPAEAGAPETRLEARRASGNSRARDLL